MITLRIASKLDAPKLFNSIEYDRSHLSILPWSTSITQDSLGQFIEDKLKSNDILYVIHHPDDGAIGTVDLRINGRIIDLGYWIGAKHARKGFMKESLSILSSIWNSPNYDKVTAKTRVDNVGSSKVLISSGFQLMKSDTDWHYYELKINPAVLLTESDAF